jgi:hypothetical protein
MNRRWLRACLGGMVIVGVLGLVLASARGHTGTRAPQTQALGGVPALGSSAVGQARSSHAATTRKTTSNFGPVVVTGHLDGISAPVRDLPIAVSVPSAHHAVENEPLRAAHGVVAADPALQTQAGSTPVPDTSVSFRGLCDLAGTGGCPNNLEGCAGCLPPDTDGEVGPSQYVQMVNSNFAVFSKSGAVLKGSTAINALWSSVADPNDICKLNNNGDPIVLYDQLANRWLLTQFTATAASAAHNGECIAVSTSGDATGSYYLYTFSWAGAPWNDTFYDYPHLGVWPDAYYMTANEFPPNQQLSQGFGAFAFERAKMLAGDPTARVVFFDVGQSSPPQSTFYAGALPSDLDGTITPAAGEPNFFAEVDDPVTLPAPPTGSVGWNMRIWKFHVDWTTPANSTFGTSGNPNYILPVDTFARIPCVYGLPNVNCVPQKNGVEGLDALDDRLMFRLAYRNFGASPPAGVPANTESLVLNGTVSAPDANNPASSVYGIRWYEVRNPNGNAPDNAPKIYQQGTYAPNGDPTHVLWRWMGSVAMDHMGNMAAGFSASGPNDFPTIRYAGRLVSSPLGVLDQSEKTVVGPAYSGPQTNVESRWGDYSDMTVDPVDDCTFWYTQEYLASDLVVVGDWQTWVSAFKFPSCTGSPTAVATRSFISHWTKAGVALSWRTASETDLLGFNVWRSSGKSWRLVNPTLIHATHAGTTGGAVYRLFDRTARSGRFYSYRLQTVALSGKRAWFGVGSVPVR